MHRLPSSTFLLEAFVEGLQTEYGDADDEGVYYDGREGGYQWHPTWDTWDLVEDFSDVLTGEGLLDAVQEAMDDRVWVEVHLKHLRDGIYEPILSPEGPARVSTSARS